MSRLNACGACPTEFAKLNDLGSRICIVGPSNSGKSTLAAAIGRARCLPVVHLDQLRHLPETDWHLRDDKDFAGLHADVIAGERWVIDGNYSALLPDRLRRATGLILLDLSTATSLWRYLRRSWFERDRIGGLPGGKDSVKWSMIRHIAVTTRANRRRYPTMLEGFDGCKVYLATPRAFAAFYRLHGLNVTSSSH